MPRGSSSKREREYNELKSEFKKEGRYKGRETEVAARIVNKQRAQYGETKGEKRKIARANRPIAICRSKITSTRPSARSSARSANSRVRSEGDREIREAAQGPQDVARGDRGTNA